MRRNLKTVVAASAVIGGLLAAPALYAHDTEGGGMMGGMMQGRGMMEDCSEMMEGMGGGQRPNEQWQDRQPEPPQPEGNAG